MKMTSDIKQPIIQRERNNVLICFNEQEVTIEGVTKYTYDSVRTAFPYTYANLVSAIIVDKYPQDVMQAIINNHLLGDDEQHEAEYIEMQEWRSLAKRVAREIMK